jgi:hypothetical protein
VTVGANNRERRRAKQKARQDQLRRRQERAGSQPESGHGSPAWAAAAGLSGRGHGALPAYQVEPVVREAVFALHGKDEETVRRCCAALVDDSGWVGGQRAVDSVLTTIAQRDLSEVWARGWQPVDVVRAARRGCGARPAQIVVDVIAAQMRGYAAATVDERWEAQLRDLGAEVWWTRDDEYLSALGEREGLTRAELIRCFLQVLHVFNTCPEIQVLCPPPGRARRGSLGVAAASGRAADPRQLERVRALLAKAESTSFAAEAETYTAKAQELMARYSIDYALLSVGEGTRDEPVGRRIGVENPYEAAKVLLLDAVAGANRCRAIWSSSFGFVTVLGFAADIDAVELLFTSLLVQATAAMMRAGSRRDAHGRSTTRSFRQSFLTAYAHRIGERLATATEQATEQASRELAGQPGADRLLPILASRDGAVGALADELFPALVGRTVAVTNRDGWASGRAAADQAHLATRHAVDAEA